MSEKDIDDAMREIRIALLEADVSLPVVKEFIAKVKEQSVGEKVVRSIQPGQMVVKIVHDELVKLLGGEGSELNLNAVPPACILMVGLQGSGKTTTSAKIANRLKNKKKVMLVSLADAVKADYIYRKNALGDIDGIFDTDKNYAKLFITL